MSNAPRLAGARPRQADALVQDGCPERHTVWVVALDRHEGLAATKDVLTVLEDMGMARLEAVDVAVEGRILHGSEEVVRVDEQALPACLPESEAVDQRGRDKLALHLLPRVEEHTKAPHGRINAVQVPVARDGALRHGLHDAVHLPRGSWPLGVASQPLLRDDEQRVAWGSAQRLHLLLQDRGLVLVVELRGGAVATGQRDVISCEAEDRQRTAEPRDGDVVLPPVQGPTAPGQRLQAQEVCLRQCALGVGCAQLRQL
mmetsp:Transcript_75175/g.168337  ORF Transcript_75175/g.168337 Transcript_75175/m.168337 type:complete len:258 (-) Transcript_75175:10010-10783(-)